MAAHAVHAALEAMGVHPGTPVVVLGGSPSEILKMKTVIRDAGRTELEPGTLTAGTDWTVEDLVAGEKYTCALWYWSYKSPYYELCETEKEAAGLAWGIEDGGNGSVWGVQFEDGTFIERDDWPEYEAEQERQTELWKQQYQEQQAKPKPELRRVRVPVGRDVISIPVSEPAWLGRPMEE